MTEPAAGADPAVTEAAALISRRLDERLDETTHAIQGLLDEESPELAGDAALLALLRETVVANVDTYFSAVRRDVPVADVEAPPIALEHARRLAQRGLPLDALVRGYRLGHAVALKFVIEEIRAAGLDPALGLRLFEQMSMTSFGYIDQMSQRVVSVYQDERERWLANRNALRAVRVREILAGTDADVDVDAATTAIRYPLRRVHVAVVVWHPGPDGRDKAGAAERFVAELAESIAIEAPLFIPVDDVTGWAWLPVPAAADATARIRRRAAATPDHPYLAIGAALPGVDGFRRSHQQAMAAHDVVESSGGALGRVFSAEDPGLAAAALLGANVATARVWVGEVLGPLAAATDADERLRETLRVFLRTGSSYKAAGAELHFHVNTVKYRVQRAIERRGRPIAEDRLDVEIALLLCRWYGASVLS